MWKREGERVEEGGTDVCEEEGGECCVGREGNARLMCVGREGEMAFVMIVAFTLKAVSGHKARLSEQIEKW